MRLGLGMMLLAAVGFIVLFFWMCKLGWREHKMKKAYNKALKAEEAHQGKVWQEHAAINNLVKMYMNMVTKHGPKSEEARAFRFGSDYNKLTGDLLKNKAAKAAFDQQCDVIDATWSRMDKRRC